MTRNVIVWLFSMVGVALLVRQGRADATNEITLKDAAGTVRFQVRINEQDAVEWTLRDKRGRYRLGALVTADGGATLVLHPQPDKSARLRLYCADDGNAALVVRSHAGAVGLGGILSPNEAGIHVKDVAGTLRCSLGIAGKDLPAELLLRDPQGRRRARLSIEGDRADLRLADGKEQIQASVSCVAEGAGVYLRGKQGALHLGALLPGFGLRIEDGATRGRGFIGLKGNGVPAVELADADGRVYWPPK